MPSIRLPGVICALAFAVGTWKAQHSAGAVQIDLAAAAHAEQDLHLCLCASLYGTPSL